MMPYEVTITETLQKNVTVEADSQFEAEQIVSDCWKNGEYILDADSFSGVEFTATQAVQSMDEVVTEESVGEFISMG